MVDASQYVRFPARSQEYYRKECAWWYNYIRTMEAWYTPAAGESTRLTWFK